MDKSFPNLDNNWNSKSITCTNIPEEFLDKAVAKKHFGTFGTIKSFLLRPKHFSCSVEFESVEEAEIAKENGNVYNDYQFEIEFTEENRSPSVPEIDPDVQMELQTMKGGATFTEPALIQSTYIKKLPKSSKNDSLNGEIEQLLRRQAHSVEDRYRILDARDKLLRQLQQGEKGKCLMGSCPDMCPEKERVMREFQMQVASFEISPRTNQMDHKLAVKQYSRSSADQETPLPHELRPANVLRMSMNYLMSRIVDLSEDSKTNISDWFHFVWDRMRSIRKDITQQDLCTVEAVTLVEQCARFHIHCSARLVAEDPSVFDQKINTENLTKCLQTLKYMYRDLRLQNVACPNESEFRAYVVLLNLNDGNFLWEFQQFPDDILKSKELKFALLVYQAIENNNFVRFFQLVQNTTYLNACILLRYFIQIRLKAVRTLLKAYAPKNPSKFSLKEFSSVLAFEDFESTSNFLEYHGLTCDYDAVYLDKRNFYYPDFPYTQERSHDLVESKRRLTVGEIINGSPYTPGQTSNVETHQLQTSFDQYGYLKSDVFENVLVASKTRDSETVFKVPQTRTVSPRPRKSLEAKFEMPVVPMLPVLAPPVLVPVSNIEKKIETFPPVFSQLTPPQSGSSESSATGKYFNFLQAFGTKSTETPTVPQPIVQPLPPKVISFPTIDFDSPTKDPFNQIVQETESPDRTDSQPSSIGSPFTPFAPLTPTSTPPTSTPSPKEDLTKQYDTELKLKMIRESASDIFTDLLKEVTSEMILTCANDCLTRSKHLFENVPKAFLTKIINELMHETLTETAETELLVEQIVEARKLRSVYKVIKHWMFITRRNTYRKQQLISAPIYMDNSPLSAVAEEFRHPSQRKSMELLNKDQISSDLLSKPMSNKIDVMRIVSGELPKASNHVSYWKGVISYPDEREDGDGKFAVLMEHWLRNAFSLDGDNGTLTAKHYVKRLKQDVALSLQTIKGIADDNVTKIKSSDGAIFIANQQSLRHMAKRWGHLVSKLANKRVPVAFVVCNCHKEVTDEVSMFLSNFSLKKYKIICHSSKETSLKGCIEQALRFIASSSNTHRPTLEEEFTETCLAKALTEEFWCRVAASITENEVLWQTCRKDCTFLINVFNKALDQLISILGKPFNDVVLFPQELKELVSGEKPMKYPISFEQFRSNWNHTRHTDKLTDFLKSLKLPSFCPTGDVETLKKQIATYVETVLGSEMKNISRLVELAHLHVLAVGESDGPEVSWIDIIRLVSIQKLEDGMRQSEGFIRFVPFVVYDRTEMYKFLTEPWWLTMDMESVTQRVDRSLMYNSTFNETRKRKSTDDISFSSDEVSKILKTGEATLKKIDSRNRTLIGSYMPDKSNVVSVFQEAESYFEKNKLVWKGYEDKLFGSNS